MKKLVERHQILAKIRFAVSNALRISFGRTTTPTMSSRTPARSRQALMSPKSTTTAGGWRCDPLVNANVTRHDACRQSRDCASSPATAEVGSLQFFFGPVRVPTDTRSSRGKRARPALTQPPSSPLLEPQGEGPQGHEGRVPRRYGRRSAAAGASPPRSARAKRVKRSVRTPRLIRHPAPFAFRPPGVRGSFSFSRFVFAFRVCVSAHRRSRAPRSR